MATTDDKELNKGDFGVVDSGRIKHSPVVPTPPTGAKFKGSDLKIDSSGFHGRSKIAGPGLKMPPVAPKEFKKTINQSYSEDPNMAMSSKEKITLSKNGQWSLDKAEDCYKDDSICPKCHSKKCQCGNSSGFIISSVSPAGGISGSNV